MGQGISKLQPNLFALSAEPPACPCCPCAAATFRLHVGLRFVPRMSPPLVPRACLQDRVQALEDKAKAQQSQLVTLSGDLSNVQVSMGGRGGRCIGWGCLVMRVGSDSSKSGAAQPAAGPGPSRRHARVQHKARMPGSACSTRGRKKRQPMQLCRPTAASHSPPPTSPLCPSPLQANVSALSLNLTNLLGNVTPLLGQSTSLLNLAGQSTSLLGLAGQSTNLLNLAGQTGNLLGLAGQTGNLLNLAGNSTSLLGLLGGGLLGRRLRMA